MPKKFHVEIMNSVLRIIFIASCYLVFCENNVDATAVECEFLDSSFGYYCYLLPQIVTGYQTVIEVNGIHYGKILFIMVACAQQCGCESD